jgi:hypothetical protein
MYGHHILDFFFILKVYLINFKLNLINLFFNPTKNEKLECMEYICDKKYMLQSCIYTSKLGLWVAFLGEFFMVYDIDTWIKSKTI